jgi:hypothetical protein
MTSRVEIGEGVVTKFGDPALMRIEARKMVLAREIGMRTGRFRVPEIIDFDQATGKLVIERINGLTGFRRVRWRGPELARRAEEAGLALAAVHAQLVLPPDMNVPIPEELDGPGPRVFLHGDYSAENVCVSDGGRGQLTIIDWSMTGMHGGYASSGTAYFDVVWFVNNLFSKPAYGYVGNPAPGSLAKQFILAYFGDSSLHAGAEFDQYHRRFFDLKISSRMRTNSWLRRGLMAHGHGQWKKFIEEFQKGSCEND